MNQDEYSEPIKPEVSTVIEPEEPQTPTVDAAIEPANENEAATVVSEPETEPTPTESSPTPLPPTTPNLVVKPPRSRKLLVLIIAAALIVIMAAAAAYVVNRNNKSITQPAAAAKTVHKVAKPAATLPPASGFTDSYLAEPQLLSPQPSFFTDLTAIGYDCGTPATASNPGCHITYSKIGTTKAGQPILLVDNGEQGEASVTFLALQTSSDKYVLLLNPTGTTAIDSNQDATLKKALKPNVTVDRTTRLVDLKFDQNVTYQGAALTTKDASSGVISGGYVLPNGLASLRSSYFDVTDTSKVTKLGSYGAQTVYQAIAQQDSNYKVAEIYFTINHVYAGQYYLDSALNNTKSPPFIKWTNGDINSDSYTYRAPGCGSYGGYLVAKGLSDTDLTKTGSGPNGEVLYSVATDSALFQEIYNNDYGTGETLQDASLKHLTAAQFQAKHAVFLTKNGFGELVIYQDSKFLSGGGCGKPVVYLYPTRTTNVNVSVGADIRQSEPAYPTGGWKQVLAQPNGQLTYQGQDYPNLFWEGIGHGQYPIISSGTVVRGSEAVATIRHQLFEQGLKPNEINDFMDYWQPRLPQTAYVRLTWFNTKQMDQLAPLTILPKPTTSIRVFLDFQGLDRQIPLAKQQLSAPARKGFTVVEWGGLDRSFDKR